MAILYLHTVCFIQPHSLIQLSPKQHCEGGRTGIKICPRSHFANRHSYPSKFYLTSSMSHMNKLNRKEVNFLRTGYRIWASFRRILLNWLSYFNRLDFCSPPCPLIFCAHKIPGRERQKTRDRGRWEVYEGSTFFPLPKV